MEEQLEKQEQLMLAIEDYTEYLTPDQLRVLPYLAHGISIGKTAAATGVSPTAIRKWKDEEIYFHSALAVATETISEWHNKRLNEISIKAWNVAEAILSQDYETADERQQKEMALMARHIIDKLGVNKRSDLHVTHEVISPELNVSEQSADVIAKRIMELEKHGDEPPAVEGEYSIKEVDPRYQIHPETDYGKLNIDKEKHAIQCHICGEWVTGFVRHIDEYHGLMLDEYRTMYRLGDNITEKWLSEL